MYLTKSLRWAYEFILFASGQEHLRQAVEKRPTWFRYLLRLSRKPGSRPKPPRVPNDADITEINHEDALQSNFEDDIQNSSCDTCASIQSLDIHPGAITYMPVRDCPACPHLPDPPTREARKQRENHVKNAMEHRCQRRPFVVVWTYQEPDQPIRAKGYPCTDNPGSNNSLCIPGKVNYSRFKRQRLADRTLSLKGNQRMKCYNFVETEAGLQDQRIDDLERWNGQNFELNAAGLIMLQGIEGCDNMVGKFPCGHDCRSARSC